MASTTCAHCQLRLELEVLLVARDNRDRHLGQRETYLDGGPRFQEWLAEGRDHRQRVAEAEQRVIRAARTLVNL